MDYSGMSDLDLLVEHETQTVNAFGYGSYRFENQEQTRKFREAQDAARDEAVRRGLMNQDSSLTEKGSALSHMKDRRVEAKRADNQQYFAARFGGRGHHTSPFGERY
jgi:hypothetical protein